jgi:hypothetical protein
MKMRCDWLEMLKKQRTDASDWSMWAPGSLASRRSKVVWRGRELSIHSVLAAGSMKMRCRWATEEYKASDKAEGVGTSVNPAQLYLVYSSHLFFSCCDWTAVGSVSSRSSGTISFNIEGTGWFSICGTAVSGSIRWRILRSWALLSIVILIQLLQSDGFRSDGWSSVRLNLLREELEAENSA